MEASSLAHAHTHARNASLETRKANHLAASEEHDLAAAEFATAAKETTDSEALRTLKLLEQHHARLAELLKDRPRSAHTPLSETSEDAATTAAKSLSERPTASTPLETTITPPTLNSPTPIRLPPREPSSSIASNLASARGIPSNRQRQPLSSPAKITAQHAEGRLSSPTNTGRQNAEVERRRRAREASRDATAAARPEEVSATQTLTSTSVPPPLPMNNTEDAFSRFYNTFSPWISRLSAPLAFAGLPLVPDTESAPSDSSGVPKASSPSSSTTTVKASKGPSKPTPKPPTPSPPKPLPKSSTPDLTSLISAPALRALQSSQFHHPPPSESFYVVPTTGGTISYAGVLSRLPPPHQQSGSNLSEIAEDEQEFVDAPSSPTLSRTRSHTGAAGDAGKGANKEKRVGNKTMEELHMENVALRKIADDFSRRLQAFEMGAMKGSMALHASLRAAMQSNSSPAASGVGPLTPLLLRRAGTEGSEAGSGAKGDAGSAKGDAGSSSKVDERVEKLEGEATALRKEMAHLRRENEKLKGVVQRYREKWEKLKDGARERMGGEGRRREAE